MNETAQAGGFDADRISHIRNLPTLDRDQSIRLAREIESMRARLLGLKPGQCSHDVARLRRSRALERAEHRLALANIRLVIWATAPYRAAALPQEDLVQEGFLGLLRAIQLYCPRAGFKFSTYAIFWIRRAILRAIQDKSRIIRMPVRSQGELQKLNLAGNELAQAKGREPSTEQIAQVAHIPARKAERLLLRSRRPLSIYRRIGADGTLIDRIPGEAPSIQEDDSIPSNVRRLLATLPRRESRILRLRFGLNGRREYSLRELARVFGVSAERIRQIERRALRRLRESGESRPILAQIRPSVLC